MQEHNNVNEKNNAVRDYEFIEKLICPDNLTYIVSKISEFTNPFIGGFIHASIPDFPDASGLFTFLGTLLGLSPALLKYPQNKLTLQYKETFKKDIGMIGCGDSGTVLESKLMKLDQDKREKAFNQVKNFVGSDKDELSDYLGREVNKSAFRGVFSYAAGFCFKRMFF